MFSDMMKKKFVLLKHDQVQADTMSGLWLSIPKNGSFYL